MEKIVDRTEVPTAYRFQLEQNSPNLFNPVTVFSFQIPDAGRARLSVYDVLGRQVATIVDEEKSPGIHQVWRNAGNVLSGVYFYKLQAGGFSDVKKLLLAR